jgi:predicted Zn-dependent protease
LSLDAGDPKTAVRFLAQAAAGASSDAGTLGMLARARWLTGDRDGARSALAAALAVGPADPDLERLGRTIR